MVVVQCSAPMANQGSAVERGWPENECLGRITVPAGRLRTFEGTYLSPPTTSRNDSLSKHPKPECQLITEKRGSRHGLFSTGIPIAASQQFGLPGQARRVRRDNAGQLRVFRSITPAPGRDARMSVRFMLAR